MSILDNIKDKARANGRRVVLPEGDDPRTIQAIKTLTDEKLAGVTVLGNQDTIKKLAAENGADLSSVEVIDPASGPDFDKFVAELVELRKAKHLSEENARQLMANPLYYGAMLVRNDKADASVAGAANTTGDVLRAALHCIGLKEGIKAVSSCFMMTIPEYRGEKDKILFFADCAVIPNPNPQQLASIASSTADTLSYLTGDVPKVAFLSFSTKGSAKHADVDKVLEALDILKEIRPDLQADGEMQLDAAIVPEIGKKKAPGSDVAGDANVLVFPDLDAGNIGYKLVQRLAGAIATGPIIQGLAKPANDLSRGCSAQDIVDVTAIATLMRG